MSNCHHNALSRHLLHSAILVTMMTMGRVRSPSLLFMIRELDS